MARLPPHFRRQRLDRRPVATRPERAAGRVRPYAVSAIRALAAATGSAGAAALAAARAFRPRRRACLADRPFPRDPAGGDLPRRRRDQGDALSPAPRAADLCPAPRRLAARGGAVRLRLGIRAQPP